MYRGLISAVVIVATYLALMAVFGHFRPGMGIFKPKAAAAFILGGVLAIPVSWFLFERSSLAGYIGVAISISVMCVLFYLNDIIKSMKSNRKAGHCGIVKNVLVILGILLAVTVFTLVVWKVLEFLGI